MASVAVVEAALRLDAKQFSKAIDQAKADVKKLAGDGKALAAGLGAGLLAAGTAAGALALSFKNAADNADGLADSLSGAFKDNQLDIVLAQVRELEALGAATGSGLVDASKRFKLFEKDASKSLLIVADIAAKSGSSFDSLAEAYARLGQDEKAAKAFLKLSGIQPGRLVEFGAVLDQVTGKLKTTGAEGELLVKAVEKLATSADGGIVGSFEATQDATSHLGAELKLLREDIGAGLVAVFDDAAAKLLPLAQGFRELSSETKANIGLGIGLASVVATGAAGFIGLGLAVTAVRSSYAALLGGAKALQGTLVTLAGTARNAITALSGFAATPYVAALAAAGITAKLLADQIIKVNNAMADQVRLDMEALDVEQRRAEAAKTLDQFVGKTAQQLYDSGKLSTQVGDAVGALQQKLQGAVAAGDQGLKAQLSQQIKDLAKVRDDLAAMEDRDRSRVAARNAAADPAVAAANQASRDKEAAADKAQREADLKERLDNIALELAQKKITQGEALELERKALIQYEADQEQRRALAIETAKFESQTAAEAAKKAAENAETIRQGKLDKELARIELLRTQNQISSNDEINLMKRVLANYQLTEQEKQSLTLKTAQLEKAQIETKRAALEQAQAKELAATQKHAEEMLAAAQKAKADVESAQADSRTLKGQALDTKVQDLQDNTSKTGKDNTGALTQAYREKLALDIESIRLEADKAKAATDSADARILIEQNATERIRQLRASETKEFQSELQKQLDAQKKLEDERKKKRGDFTLGGTFGIQDLNASIQGSLGANLRSSGDLSTARSSSLLNAIYTPLQSADPGMGRATEATFSEAAQTMLEAARVFKDTRVQVDVKSDGPAATARPAPSGDGRQGSLVTTSRSVRRKP